jgi:hypothetical protein
MPFIAVVGCQEFAALRYTWVISPPRIATAPHECDSPFAAPAGSLLDRTTMGLSQFLCQQNRDCPLSMHDAVGATVGRMLR